MQKIERLPPGNWKALFVSDLHIVSGTDDRARLLLALLGEAEQKGIEGFFLLGDVFDFCAGTHTRFHKKFAPIFEKLEQLKKAGKEVIFLEGNHEFSMQFYPTTIAIRGIKTHLYRLEKYNTAIAHGDLFAAPQKYLWFRRNIKSSWLRKLTWLVPGWVLDCYAWGHSGSSRQMDHYRKINKEKVLESAAEHLEAQSYTAKNLIFGHFHYPFDETRKIKGVDTKLLSMHSWDKPSCLLLNDSQEFQRVFLHES